VKLRGGRGTTVRNWWAAEDALLLSLLNEGRPVTEIARLLGRSASSIYNRRRRLCWSEGRRRQTCDDHDALRVAGG
jgi:hypothetical protein